jgi:hypothetical protein
VVKVPRPRLSAASGETPIEEVVVGARSPLHKSCGEDFAWSLLDAAPEATEATDELGIEPRPQFNGPIEWMEVHTGDHRTPVLREALCNIAQAGHVRLAVTVDDLTLKAPTTVSACPPASSVVEGSSK